MPDIDYTPPAGVRSACQRGLDLAPEHGGPGLTEGTKSRARSIASGKAISADTARRMKAFHARHTYEKVADPPSPGYVAWKLWGGDAGQAWAEKLVRQQDAVAKGGKALGAAFSHARASGKSQSRAAQRRRASAWLKANGHAPIGKGVLDRWRALSIEERGDEGLLLEQGFAPDEARALAMAGTGRRTRKAARVAKADYASAYVAAARDALPKALHDQLHRKARGSAGGVASRRARAGRTDATKGDRMLAIAALREELRRLVDEVDKGAPTLSEVLPAGETSGVPGVSGPPRGAKRRAKRRRDRLAERMAKAALAASMPISKAESPQVRNEHVVPTNGENAPYTDPRDIAPFLDAQRLVLGMDLEMTQGHSVADAQQRASWNLASNMGAYDNSRPGGAAMQRVGGLDVDLGSGNARALGFLGLDVYPYDHGTVIHDVNLGIPFASGSGRQVRLVNALDAIVGDQPAMPLFLECQRFLGVGGRLEYVGPALGDRVDWRRMPGMQVIERQLSEPTDDGAPQTEMLLVRRVAARLPAVHGADPTWLGYTEETPLDALLAQYAYEGPAAAATAMANLVHKGERVERHARVVKADEMRQVVYGAVLVPEECDSQGDIISAAEIEETAHQFLIDARVVGSEHADPMEGASVVESYIAPSDMSFSGGPYGPQSVPAGSWVLGVKIADKDAWQQVLDGEYTGFSVGGYGQREAA